MSISTYATSYSEVIGVALICDVEWINPIHVISKEGAALIQTAAMSYELMSGDINDGQALQLGDYLDKTLAITQALLTEFSTNVFKYNGLSSAYSAIQSDPTVPGTIKGLILIKSSEPSKKAAKLNSGIAAANKVISLHKTLVKEIGEFAKSTQDFKFE